MTRMDVGTRTAVFIAIIVIFLLLALALYGYLSGAWDVDPTAT